MILITIPANPPLANAPPAPVYDPPPSAPPLEVVLQANSKGQIQIFKVYSIIYVNNIMQRNLKHRRRRRRKTVGGEGGVGREMVGSRERMTGRESNGGERKRGGKVRGEGRKKNRCGY